MDYLTPWDIVKRFLLGWVIAGLLLVLVSCILHFSIIAAAVMSVFHSALAILMYLLVIGWVFSLIIR